MNRIILSRRTLLALGGAAMLAGRQARAAVDRSLLYRGRAIVTGQRDETRIPGLKQALTQALCRVSGDQRLARHPGLSRFTAEPQAAVKDVSYLDLYAFRPIRDEQGTRDRPYLMTVRYEPEKIDAMLEQLGSKPWLAERPVVKVFIAVHHIATSFVLAATGESGELMREALDSAAWNSAIKVATPMEKSVRAAGLTVDNLPERPLTALEALVDHEAGQVPLAGTLNWSKEMLAWKAAWRMQADGKEHHWAIEGVNFDAAFRNALAGAAQILSGNGEPETLK